MFMYIQDYINFLSVFVSYSCSVFVFWNDAPGVRSFFWLENVWRRQAMAGCLLQLQQ